MIAILGRRCGLGLVATETDHLFFHLCKLLGFAALLLLEFLHFQLEFASLRSDALILQLLLFKLR